MQDWQIITITAAVIIGVVLLVLKGRLHPAISLVVGALALGLATGLGIEETTETVMRGFGNILYEVGLLIAWGVLTGSLLHATGAITRLVDSLLRIFGVKGVPYALAISHGTVLQSIFPDVMLVMSAPLVRRMVPFMGKNGRAKLASAMALGIEVGVVMVVPGVGALALAGVMGVSLGKMLLFGGLVGVLTMVITQTIMSFAFDRGFWNPRLDEAFHVQDDGEITGEPENNTGTGGGVQTASETRTETTTTTRRKELPLGLLFAPMVLALVLMAIGGVLEIAGGSHPVLDFLATPVVALLIGLLGTFVLAWRALGIDEVETALGNGFRESGLILILTGAGGSLAEMVGQSGMGDILGKFFSANSAVPLLTVWAIAAVLHIAVGSIVISSITAASLLAPVAAQIGLDPVLIALAAGAGSMFLVHVTSNTFWLLQSLLGQTTRGAFKTVSIGISVASVVALGLTLVLSMFF
ncbi:GntP family permease [Corynebacterium sp. A21]|uniref:GntP family permease n=1 Tax=Corynebacterium sp. A21 TaxID=3457318 RepID=UPI003FD198CC